jgi:hypothetical protein
MSARQRIVAKRSHFRMVRLERTLFAKHLHVQVTVGFDPILVDFDRQCSDQPQQLCSLGNSDDMGAAFELLVDPLEHIGTLKMFVVLPG